MGQEWIAGPAIKCLPDDEKILKTVSLLPCLLSAFAEAKSPSALGFLKSSGRDLEGRHGTEELISPASLDDGPFAFIADRPLGANLQAVWLCRASMVFQSGIRCIDDKYPQGSVFFEL